MTTPTYLRGVLRVLVITAVLGAPAASLVAQVTDQDLAAIASWIAVDSATGYETRTSPALAKALGGWTADRYGNVVRTVGTGSPHRIVACALDRPGYAVSQITDDGYLRGPGSASTRKGLPRAASRPACR